MPPEEDNIEQLLRKYSEERKGEEPPLVMPGPMRNALHQQIARQFPAEKTKSGWFKSLPAFWPGFALTGLLAATLGVTVYFLRPGEDNSFRLAQEVQKPSSETGAVFPGEHASASPSGRLATLATRNAEREVKGGESKGAERLTGPALANLGSNQFLKKFTRLEPAEKDNSNSPSRSPLAAILPSFTLEIAGNQVRIIDADGSTYTGKQVAASLGELDKRQKLPPAAAGQFISFEVKGVNNRLNSSVLFRGEVKGQTNNLSRPMNQGMQAQDTKPVSVEGKVTVGGTNVFSLRAVPVQE